MPTTTLTILGPYDGQHLGADLKRPNHGYIGRLSVDIGCQTTNNTALAQAALEWIKENAGNVLDEMDTVNGRYPQHAARMTIKIQVHWQGRDGLVWLRTLVCYALRGRFIVYSGGAGELSAPNDIGPISHVGAGLASF